MREFDINPKFELKIGIKRTQKSTVAFF